MESAEEPRMKQDKHGTKRWRLKNNQLHRIGAPAVEFADGSKFWYQFDELHREDGPAMETAVGAKAWYVKGKFHRLDGPAIERPQDYIMDSSWYVNGKHFKDVVAWAKAALEYENINPTQEKIDDKIAQVMQVDLFN